MWPPGGAAMFTRSCLLSSGLVSFHGRRRLHRHCSSCRSVNCRRMMWMILLIMLLTRRARQAADMRRDKTKRDDGVRFNRLPSRDFACRQASKVNTKNWRTRCRFQLLVRRRALGACATWSLKSHGSSVLSSDGDSSVQVAAAAAQTLCSGERKQQPNKFVIDTNSNTQSEKVTNSAKQNNPQSRPEFHTNPMSISCWRDKSSSTTNASQAAERMQPIRIR